MIFILVFRILSCNNNIINIMISEARSSPRHLKGIMKVDDLWRRGMKVDDPSDLISCSNKRLGLLGSALPPLLKTNSWNRSFHAISGVSSCKATEILSLFSGSFWKKVTDVAATSSCERTEASMLACHSFWTGRERRGGVSSWWNSTSCKLAANKRVNHDIFVSKPLMVVAL